MQGWRIKGARFKKQYFEKCARGRVHFIYILSIFHLCLILILIQFKPHFITSLLYLIRITHSNFSKWVLNTNSSNGRMPPLA